MWGGHDHAGDAIGAERVDREQGDEGRVDAAREGQADVAEAVLGDVVAQAEDQRPVDLGEVGERLGDAARGGGGESRSQTSSSSSNCAARASTPPLGVENEALAVEDQLVLAADQVAEGEVGAVGAGEAGEQLLALAALAAVVGRAGGVGDQRRAFGDLGRGGRALDPAVLADRQPDPGAGDVDRRRLGAGDEVALLVEDRVVGQAVLAVDGRTAPSASTARALWAWRKSPPPAAGSAKPTRATMPSTPAGDLLHGPAVGLDEVALQVEVLGRVAGHAELREDGEVGALGAGAAIHSETFAALASMSPTVGLICARATRMPANCRLAWK